MFEPNYKLEQTNVNLGAVKAVGTCVITNEVYSTKEFSLKAYNDWINSNNPIQNTGLISLSQMPLPPWILTSLWNSFPLRVLNLLTGFP